MKRRRVVPILIVFGILTLVWSREGMAGTLQDVKARGVLIAGVRTDLVPFGFLDTKGINTGFDIDIAHSLAKALFGKDDAVQFVPVTRANGMDFLNEKKIDLLLGGLTPESHKTGILYSVPYFESGHLILARDDSKIARYQDLAGKKVATILGSTADSALRESVPRANRVIFKRHSEALDALKERRVDAFVDTALIIIHLQRRNSKLKIAGFQPFGNLAYAVGVREGDEEWLGFVNATLTKMKETGQQKKLSEKWFAEAMALLLGFEKPVTPNKGDREDKR